MPKLNQAHVVSLLLVSLVVVALALLVLQYTQETEEAPELFSIAGKVASVDQQANSFTVLQSTDGQSFSVRLGEDTNINRLVPPFDINNRPEEEATFTLEKRNAALEDIQEGDSVFVRSSHAIGAERKIVNPLEVQILP